MRGISNLSDEKWRSHLSEGSSESDQETRADEHAEILSAGLENGTQENDNRAEHDTTLAADSVCNIWSKRNGAEGTNRLDSIEETKLFIGWVVEVLLRRALSQ